MRKCSKCGIIKSETEFRRDKRGKGGIPARCKTCKNEQDKEWVRRNPEKRRKILKRHTIKYREFYKEKAREYKRLYPEKAKKGEN